MRINLHRREHLNDLLQAPAEGVELAEDVHLRKLKLPLVRLGLQHCLRPLEARLVFLVQVDAVAQLLKHLVGRLCPNRFRSIAGDVRLTGSDHLVRDLMEGGGFQEKMDKTDGNGVQWKM